MTWAMHTSGAADLSTSSTDHSGATVKCVPDTVQNETSCHDAEVFSSSSACADSQQTMCKPALHNMQSISLEPSSICNSLNRCDVGNAEAVAIHQYVLFAVDGTWQQAKEMYKVLSLLLLSQCDFLLNC